MERLRTITRHLKTAEFQTRYLPYTRLGADYTLGSLVNSTNVMLNTVHCLRKLHSIPVTFRELALYSLQVTCHKLTLSLLLL